jgi:hypothetical protein
MARTELVTSLSPDECRRRLKAVVGSSLNLGGTESVTGLVGNTARLCKRIAYRNSFQTVLVARFLNDNGATRIECRYRVNLFVIGFMTIWFGGLVVPLLTSLPDLVNQLQTTGNIDGHWHDMLFTLGMVGAGAGVIRFCRYLARGEAAFLTDFVSKTLDAKVMPVGPV